MTSKYRIIARDKDGKELDRIDSEFPYAACATLSAKYPDAHTVTIERLPPEEAEPRVVWLNLYEDKFFGGVHQTKDKADKSSDPRRTACVQFIEAKITESQLTRLREKLAEQGWTMAGQATSTELRAALAAALGIKP